MARALRILDDKHRARCAIFCPCPPCGRQGRPGEGSWQAPYHEPRGSAPRERDHRGGDHPVPSRTRQLSPPSPRVLQRQAAGGQGVALAEGAFRFARRGGVAAPDARIACAGRGPQGDRPLRAFPRFAEVVALLAALRATAARFRAAGPGRGSRAGPEGALRAVPLAGPISVLGR